MVILVLTGVVFLYLGFRNSAVHDYRIGLLDLIDTATHMDITRDRPWRWRYDAFRSVSYNEMLYKFWRHIDSFYLDRSFLDPNSYGAAHGDEHHLQGGV